MTRCGTRSAQRWSCSGRTARPLGRAGPTARGVRHVLCDRRTARRRLARLARGPARPRGLSGQRAAGRSGRSHRVPRLAPAAVPGTARCRPSRCPRRRHECRHRPRPPGRRERRWSRHVVPARDVRSAGPGGLPGRCVQPARAGLEPATLQAGRAGRRGLRAVPGRGAQRAAPRRRHPRRPHRGAVEVVVDPAGRAGPPRDVRALRRRRHARRPGPRGTSSRSDHRRRRSGNRRGGGDRARCTSGAC